MTWSLADMAASARALVAERWREDRLPLLAMLVAFIVMTWPLAQYIDHTLPVNNVDTHTALWQNWWLREALTQGWDINHSHLLFHPTGLDVSLQPRRWTSFPLWTTLYTLVGDPLAFNLVAALGILWKCYGMYLLGMRLFGGRLPALCAGLYFVFNSYSLRVALERPNTGATEWIPWFMLFFMLALWRLRDGARWRDSMPLTLLAAVCFSLNLYMNLKIGILAMLLGGGYALLYLPARGLWRSRECWLSLTLFGLSAAVLCAPLLLHALGSEGFAAAASRPALIDPTLQADLGWQWFRLGWMSALMALLGVAFAWRWRRGGLLWLALAAVFNLLSLGIVAHFMGKPLDFHWTPYRILQDNFFFRTLNYPIRMYGIFTFAYALLIGYGFCLSLRWLGGRRLGLAAVMLLAALTLFDTRIFPITLRSAARSDYVHALDDLEPGAIIDAPFGRQTAKYYMSLQRVHGRPLVEGMIARMPVDAYDYIEANPALAPFMFSRIFVADDAPEIDMTPAQWQASVDQLAADGFRYLVMHYFVPARVEIKDYERPAEWALALLDGQPTVYADDEVAIYDLLQLDADMLAAAQNASNNNSP